MKAHRAQVLDRLVAAKEKEFREKLNKRSCRVLGGNTSPSDASYSASVLRLSKRCDPSTLTTKY
jgi:hypothetical protein